MEMYIFGPEQFSQELYSSASGRFAPADSDDDSDDEDSDDEESDDEELDDEGSDDGTDDGTDDGSDDGSDDGGTGGGTCVLTETRIGNWMNNGAVYQLQINGNTTNLPAHFTDNNTRFYYEVTSGNNTRRYIFQRQ